MGQGAILANRSPQLGSKLSSIPPVTPIFPEIVQELTDPSASGSSGSYQRWANQVGDQSYTFNNTLPYFRKSPHFTPPNYAKRGAGSDVLYDQTAFSSYGGPLQVSYSNFYQPVSSFIKQAFINLGLQNLAGLSSGKLLGFSEFTLTIDPLSGTRSSSETSFMQEAIASSTLQVYQQTLAKNIVFDKNKTATGVSVVTAGTEYTLSATKEVILAAGVVCQATRKLASTYPILIRNSSVLLRC